MPKITKGHNSWSIFSEYIQKLIWSSTDHKQSIHGKNGRIYKGS